jgi:hypothetical protein
LQIGVLKAKLHSVSQKYNLLKSRYATLVKINSDKDMQIESLHLKQPNKKLKSGRFLQDYSEIFSDEQILRFECVNDLKKGDATFVRIIIEVLYVNDEQIPTLKVGIKHDRPQLPREILDLIKAMYKLRLRQYCANDADFIFRFKKANSHVSNALNALTWKKHREN